MTNQSPTAFRTVDGIDFPSLTFPAIMQGVGFYEPISFTSPELSARMAN